MLLALGCGDEANDIASTTSPCGPNGVLHIGAGVDPHCHCDDGFVAVDETCVAEEPIETTPEPEPTVPDCGPNGSFDTSQGICDCDPGYTVTGTNQQRTCELIPPCEQPDDEYEPNNAFRDATALRDVNRPLFACPADADVFEVWVTGGDRITAAVRFDGSVVDLDLLLFSPSSGTRLQSFSASSSGNSETAGFVARQDGYARIVVAPYGLGQGPYELSVDVQAGELPMCAGPGGFCRAPQDCCSGFCHINHCH